MDITHIPEKLQICKAAKEKMKLYSKLANEGGSNRECYGFLLNPKSAGDLVVHDVNLAHDQDVSGAHANVGAGLMKTKTEMENEGYQPIGCWHSHHDMGAWHSSVDDSNIEALVKRMALTRTLAQGPQSDSLSCLDGSNLSVHVNGLTFSISPSRAKMYFGGCSHSWQYLSKQHEPSNDVFDNFSLAIQYDGGIICAGKPLRQKSIKTLDEDGLFIINSGSSSVKTVSNELELIVLKGVHTKPGYVSLFTADRSYLFAAKDKPALITGVAYSAVISNNSVYAEICTNMTNLESCEQKLNRRAVGVEYVNSISPVVNDIEVLRAQIIERLRV